MTTAFTDRGTSSNNTSVGNPGFLDASQTISGLSYGANELVLAVISDITFQVDQTAVPTSLSGAGLTFDLVGSSLDNVTSGICISLWRAMSGSGGSGSLTLTYGQTRRVYLSELITVSGVLTSGTNGADAVRNFTSGTPSVSGSGTSVTANMGSFASAGNGAVYGTLWTNPGTGTPNCSPDWGTELVDFGSLYASGAGSIRMATQYRTSANQTAVGTWASAGYITALAAEIVADTGGGLGPLMFRRNQVFVNDVIYQG